MQAALDLVEEGGASAATYSAIGERAGYSRGLVSHHFGSKTKFVTAVIEALHTQMEEDVRLIVEDQALTGLAAIHAYVERFFAAFRGSNAYRGYFIVLSSVVAEKSELSALFADSHQRAKQWIAELIERGRVDGTINSGVDPEATALLLGSLLMGVSIQSMIDPEVSLDQVESQIKTMISMRFS